MEIMIERLQTPTEDELEQVKNLLIQHTGQPSKLSMTEAHGIGNSSFWLVAREDDQSGMPIVGMATLIRNRHPGGYSGLVEDVIVLDSYSRNRIEVALMQDIIEIARVNGMTYIDLNSGKEAERGAANCLYLSLGFKLSLGTNPYRIYLR